MTILGTVRRHAGLPSQFVASRNVDVWLPPDYSEDKKYPVLYMHDGQNLFEPISSYGGVAWEMDKAIVRLAETGRIHSMIVVGVWNSGIRWQEYMPQKAFEAAGFEKNRERFTEQAGGEAVSDSYLKFLVNEAKPFIDSTYPTLPEQRDTFVMGSSMGGLISLYAICQYPEIFHGAGCLSTHWPAGSSELVEEMSKMLPDPKSHKLYFDYGTEGLDADYEPFQLEMDKHLRKSGYDSSNWRTRRFDGAGHNEAAWRARVEIPLEFLLG